MKPLLALVITLGFIAFLFRRENPNERGLTNALFIPLLWMLIISGKTVAEWLQIITGYSMEGTISADSVAWTVLIIAGIQILAKRRIDVLEILRSNPWPSAFMLYCLVSVLWSGVPFWSFKHWFATLGHPIMALIILTEAHPERALQWVMKRCSYVVIPVSILLLRYYPQWGRHFSDWTGESQKAGYAHNKNSLGLICMICGLFFVWHLLNVLRLKRSRLKREEIVLCALFLLMVAYLFNGLHCGTALVCFVAGVTTILFVGSPVVNRQYVGIYFAVGIVVLLVSNLVFGLTEKTLGALDKDPTLTNRTVMWSELLKMDTNPVLGTGYDSFWEGDLKESLWDEYWWKPNEAHNGYLETYLNLGLVGICLVAGWIIATFRKCCFDLLNSYTMGLFRLAFLVEAVLFNWTEAGFKTLNAVFLIFFIISMNRPVSQFVPAGRCIGRTLTKGGRGWLVSMNHSKSHQTRARQSPEPLSCVD